MLNSVLKSTGLDKENIYRYMMDVKVILSLENTTRFPVVKLPGSLLNKAKVTPSDKYFFELAKLYGYNVTYRYFGELSFLPEPQPPTLHSIPLSRKESYQKTKPTGCFWLFCGLIILGGIIACGALESSWGVGIAAAAIWLLLFIILGGGHEVFFDKKYKEKNVPYSKIERWRLFEAAELQYRYNLSYRMDENDKRREYLKQFTNDKKIINEHWCSIKKRLWKESSKAKPCRNELKRADNPKRGIKEDAFFVLLMRELHNYVRIDYTVFGYFPDMILNIDDTCFIDIEIDEPYTQDGNSIKEIHYVGCGDDKRNEAFADNNWFVVRFAESQIEQHPTECVEILKSLVNFLLSGNCESLKKFDRIAGLIQIKCWTKEEARLMAITKTRNNVSFRKRKDLETSNHTQYDDDLPF